MIAGTLYDIPVTLVNLYATNVSLGFYNDMLALYGYQRAFIDIAWGAGRTGGKIFR